MLGNRFRAEKGTLPDAGAGVWDHFPVTAVFSTAEANRPPFRLQTMVRGGPLALLYVQAHMPEKIHIRETENRAIWPTVLLPATSVWLQVNFEPPGVCTALCAPRYPRCIKHVSAARLKAGLSHACKSSLEAVLAPWSPFSLNARVRVYYFLSSNCRFQVIISLQRENNIGSYVISTSMNLEVITEWVDFFFPP